MSYMQKVGELYDCCFVGVGGNLRFDHFAPMATLSTAPAVYASARRTNPFFVKLFVSKCLRERMRRTLDTLWELSPAAIDIIGQVCKSKAIVEFGAGRGTERLIDAGFTVYSIEHDPQWACSRAASTLIAPIVNRWYDHDLVAAYLRGISVPIGAVIIDGPIGRIGRWGVLHHWRQLNQAEAILVDDVHRPDEFGIACALVSITRRNMTIHGHDDKSFALLRGPN